MKKVSKQEIKEAILSKHKEFERVTLLFRSDKKGAILKTYASIILSIEAGESIRPEILKHFISFFRSEDSIFNEAVKNQFSNVITNVIARYKDDKDYNFSKELIINDTKRNSDTAYPILRGDAIKKKHTVHLKELLKYISHFLRGRIDIVADKNLLAEEVYRLINNYFSVFNGNSKSTLSYYKRSVLTGSIVFELYPSLSKDIAAMKGGDPTNQQLHQAVKHFTTSKK